MNRIKAVLCVGLGLVLIGVALGLLYMDVRDHAAIDLMMKAQNTTEVEKVAEVKAWQKPDRIFKAMVAGASGAGLVGMGMMLGVFELRAFRRTP